MKVLVVGGDSLIGKAIVQEFSDDQHSVTSTTRRDSKSRYFLDLLRPSTYQFINDQNFDLAIICASLTNIKYCQENQQEAFKVNVTGLKNLMRLLANKGVYIIWFSSNQPLVDTIGSQPLEYYGECKTQIECFLTDEKIAHNVIKLPKIIDSLESLLISWNSQSNNPLKAFSDHYFSPVSLSFLVVQLKNIAKQKLPGTYYFSGSHCLSYYEFAKRLWPERFIQEENAKSKGVTPTPYTNIRFDVDPAFIKVQNICHVLDYVKLKLLS
ncbi:sugar nucleotide-binding protein [Paraglaciecola sp.]|uniref:sugar nucleotide-binding protein n=1 Tax=Paraglaciecola sp. TaxID=1920173 RepID=UPI003EF1D71D